MCELHASRIRPNRKIQVLEVLTTRLTYRARYTCRVKGKRIAALRCIHDEKERKRERERTDVVCKQCAGYVSRNGKTLGERLSERIRARNTLMRQLSRGTLERDATPLKSFALLFRS